MLKSLFVSDLALIRRLEADLPTGFTVLTGETGAGKSLVLDSLGLLLSPKGGKDLVRHGSDRLEVTLSADGLSPEIRALLSELLPPEETEEIVLTRTVTREGKSTARLCGRPVPASILGSLAAGLVTIHGQNSAAGLLNEKNHLSYLDATLSEKGQAAREAYREAFDAWQTEKKALATLEQAVRDGQEKLALYEYHMAEIARVKPKEGEEEALEAKLVRLQKVEKEYEGVATAHRALSGGEKGKGAVFLLEGAARKIAAFPDKEKETEELYDLARRAREVQERLFCALEEMGDEDPGDLADRIRARMDALYRLKTKLGKSVPEILSYYEEIKEKKDLTLRGKDDIKKGRARLEEKKKALLAAGEALDGARREAAEALCLAVGETLRFLDMPKVVFQTQFTPLPEPCAEGTSKVIFLMSANAGEGLRSLSQVASGGEMSRMMLALSLHLAAEEGTIVFDEIDTGISGATAQKIGICLKKLGRSRQVLCVTHSAQVATLADHHFLVEKREIEGRTETGLVLLDREGALKENARLLGGKELGEAALTAAESLRLEGEAEYKRNFLQ